MELTTKSHKMTSGSEHMFTTVAHRIGTSVVHPNSISTPAPKVTSPGHQDLITATLIEIGVYPPEPKWTTIHLSASSIPIKAQETDKTTKKSEPLKTCETCKPDKMMVPKSKSTTTQVAPTHVAPSTCTTYYPTIMRQLSESFPDFMQENTANTTKAFLVGQSVSFSDKVKFNRIHQYLAFDNIKSGSWDCQLMVSWPHRQHGGMEVKSSSAHGSSAASGVSLDVYSASYNASAWGPLAPLKAVDKNSTNDNGPFSTWATMMKAIKVSGNRQLPASDSGKGQEKSDSSTYAKLTYFGTIGVNPGEYGLTINSEACPAAGSDTLQYLFEMPSTDSREASVSFLATKEKGAGVYLLANC
ncbi:unnamed protein product [Discula destructiva]